MKPTRELLKRDIPVLMFFNLDLGEWSEKDQKDVLELVQDLQTALEDMGHPVIPLKLTNDRIADLFTQYDPKEYIVFNWCEGIPGIPHSFGKAAQALEDLGFTFTGSSSKVLNLNDDKRKVKRILDEEKVKTPRWEEYHRSHINNWERYPAIVKPALEHCSIGISPDSIVNNPTELQKRADFVFREFEQPVIVEEFIDGREFQVGVWGNQEIEVLPAVEADFSQLDDPRDHICTVDSKDDPCSYRYQKFNIIVPAKLTNEEIFQINQICEQAYRAIGVRDYARMDIRLKQGVFYILDVNTNPYIGPECGLIQAAKLAGYTYGEFASRIINFAWQRKNP